MLIKNQRFLKFEKNFNGEFRIYVKIVAKDFTFMIFILHKDIF